MNINSKFKILNPKQTQNPKFKTRYIFKKIAFGDNFLLPILGDFRSPSRFDLRSKSGGGLGKILYTFLCCETFEVLILDLFRVSGLGFRVCLILICLCFLSGCQRTPPLYKETRVLMGTYVEVVSSDKKAAPIVFKEIKRIEDLLSKYNSESEVSKLNQLGALTVSRETLYLLKKAGEFWELSDGAFDITVGPLMDLWGFTDKHYYLPAADEIKNTLARVGFDKIIFDDHNNMVKFNTPGMKIDLGAIAKGYAVDCAVKKLKEDNITDCLVNAGGNMYGLGAKFGKPWKIAIQNPRQKKFCGYIELKDNAVATSGDYEQYFIEHKQRYSHIFNPKTGYPADSKVISATVIAPDALTADGLSTTIFILGKEKAERLLRKFPAVKVKIVED